MWHLKSPPSLFSFPATFSCLYACYSAFFNHFLLFSFSLSNSPGLPLSLGCFLSRICLLLLLLFRLSFSLCFLPLSSSPQQHKAKDEEDPSSSYGAASSS